MKKILYVNACAREGSRTNELAQHLLKDLDGCVECVNLYEEKIEPLNAVMLSKRDELLKEGKTDDEFFSLSRQFASAD
ncbi:MAG: ACP phosphodiesterase, partial [Clostridia bacterium]|nr:ACP phosphodiesterase [Clostridia bacterium]